MAAAHSDPPTPAVDRCVPRYPLDSLAAAPETPTEKVEKRRPHAEDIAPDSWDGEAAGIRVKRKRLERTR